MTTNTTQLVIDATEVLRARLWTARSRGCPTSADIGRAQKRFGETAPIMLAFLIGTIAGAMAWYGVGFVCLVLPVAMLAGLTTLASRRAMAP